MKTSNFSDVVKVVIGIWAPYTTPCSNSPPTLVATEACPRPGHSNQILGYLLEAAKIPYEVVAQPEPLVWGSPTHDDGEQYCDNWTGVLGQIHNGTADMITALYTITPQRSRCFGFTNPIMIEPSVIIHRDSEDVGDKLSALFRIYTGGVWTLALCITLLTTLALAITSHVFAVEPEEKERSFGSHLSEAFWTCMQFVSDQLSSIPKTGAMTTHTARWLLSFLGLFALFLLKLYENGLLAELLTSNRLVPFSSTREMAQKVAMGATEYVIAEGTWFEDYLRDDKITAMQPMRKALETTPLVRTKSNQEALDYVRSKGPGEVGFHVAEAVAESLVECGERGVVDHDLPAVRGAFIINKHNERLRRLLNANINAALAHNAYVIRRYKPFRAHCVAGSQELGARNLLGMFMLGAVFVGAAAVALAVELFVAKRPSPSRVRPSVVELIKPAHLDYDEEASPCSGCSCGRCGGSEGLRHRRGSRRVSAAPRHKLSTSGHFVARRSLGAEEGAEIEMAEPEEMGMYKHLAIN